MNVRRGYTTCLIATMLVAAACGGSDEADDTAADTDEPASAESAPPADEADDTAADTDGATAPSGTGKIVNLTPSLDNPWMAAYVEQFEQTATEAGFEVETQTTPFDPALQAQQLEDAIAQSPAAINLLPVSDTALVPALTRASEVGIPVILTTSPLPDGNEDLFAAFYGSDQSELGALAGEATCEALGPRGGGNVALITGAQTFGLVGLRIDAYTEAVGACDVPIEIVDVQDGFWDTATSEEIAAGLFSRFQGDDALDSIYAMADNQADGVIQAANASSIPLGTADGELVVIASNCLAAGVENIGSGDQYSTNTQIPTVQAEGNVRVIEEVLAGNEIEKFVYDPATIITADNLDEFAEACDV